jgi:TP901 family phage tail tape measure protein
MAQSYDRRINLYINVDGKNIPNNVASIKAELQKIINQQARMTLGSKEYQEQTAKITYLRNILQQHNAEINNIKKGWSLQGMADGFNRYMGLITAFAASATGLVLSFKQIIQAFNDYEERVDNLSALTGLAGDDLEWLSNKAKELSTSTLEGGIRVTQSAKDIIDAFTKTGSARPELLKNKEALVQVTEKAIILSNAAKTELQPAIEALTMVMNQYNVGADQALRIINVLAAGSKEGAGEVDYLTVAYEKAGTVASLANISIESLGAAIETLAPRITQPEIAGRSLKGVLLDLQTGADDTNPAIVGLSTAIENLGKKNLSVTELTKKFGTENINTAQLLIANIGELKNYEKAMTGTNVALEQAAINTDNNNAKLAQARNRLNVMTIELGEKLAPALQVSTSGLSYLIKGLSVSIQFFTDHKVLIVSLVSSVIAYNVAIKVATLLESGFNREKGIGLAITKLSVFWNRAASASMLLYQAAVALLAGNYAKASRAMQLFWAFAATTPIGAITAVVIGLGTALFMLSGRLTAAQKAQKMLNNVNLEAQKNIVEEKIKLGTLLDIARNEKLTKDQRLKAIAALNAINPQYIKGLTLENINTKTADDAVKAYTESLLENARVQAAKDKLVEIDKKILDAKAGEIGFWDKARNGGLLYAAGLNFIGSTEEKNAKTSANAVEDLTKQREKLIGIIEKQTAAELGSGNGNGSGGGSAAQDLVKLKEKELADAQAIIATTPAEVAARNAKVEAIQKELSALNELGTTKASDKSKKTKKDQADEEVKALEAGHNAILAQLIIQYETENWTDERYKFQQLLAEQAFLEEKKKLLQKYGQDTLQVESQISQNRVDLQKSANESFSQLYKEFSDGQEEQQQSLDNEVQAIIDSTNAALDKSKEIQEKEKQMIEQRAQLYQNISGTIVNSLTSMLDGSLDEYSSYGNALILMALDVLKQLTPIWAAQIVGGSLATPDSIMTGGIAGIAKFTAMLAIMNGFIAIAEGAVKKGIENKRNSASGSTQKRASGGFMYGQQNYTVSEAGTEWIAPNFMLRHPIIGQIISGLEDWRQNPVSVSSGAFNATKSINNNGGGFGYSSSTNQSFNPSVPQPQFSDESLARWENIVSRFEQMQFDFNFTEFEKIQNRRAIREKQSKL